MEGLLIGVFSNDVNAMKVINTYISGNDVLQALPIKSYSKKGYTGACNKRYKTGLQKNR